MSSLVQTLQELSTVYSSLDKLAIYFPKSVRIATSMMVKIAVEIAAATDSRIVVWRSFWFPK